MANYHNSIACHLPLEILITVASHLKKNDLLITSTHVCHLWRSTFLSSPCLWSHLVFSNEQHALVFLERSKSVPLSIKFKRGCTPSKMARESLKGIANRLATLQGAYTQSLDELLVQPLPILRHLNIFPFGWVGRTFLHMQSKRSLPSVRTLFTTNLGFFHVPNLVEFELDITRHWYVPIKLGGGLLNFFLGCLMLESIFLGYGDPDTDIEFTTGEESAEAVSLPYLRKFTHESPVETIHIGLFNHFPSHLPAKCRSWSQLPSCSVQHSASDRGLMSSLSHAIRPASQTSWRLQLPWVSKEGTLPTPCMRLTLQTPKHDNLAQ